VFIAVEGADGAGKTSVREHLFRSLSAAGHEVVTTWSFSWLDVDATATITGARWLGQPHDPERVVAAYARDKALLYQRIIAPQAAARIVLADRYLVSDVVYNEVLFGIPAERTWRAYRVPEIGFPDLTVSVEAPLDVCLGRIRARPNPHRWETPEVQARVHRLFREALSAGPGPVVRIRNDGPLEDTLAAVDAEVLRRCPDAPPPSRGRRGS
jgi:dTMP kinase